MGSKRNNSILSKKAAISGIIIVVILLSVLVSYSSLYQTSGYSISGSRPSSYNTSNYNASVGCFAIPSYYQNANGTLSVINGTYLSKSKVASLIQSYGAIGCCGEAALKSSIGLNASEAYGLTSQYDAALSNSTTLCSSSSPGIMS